MTDSKKALQTDHKSAKSPKEEMSKGSGSKTMNKNTETKEDPKAEKKTSSSHSR